MAGLGAIINPFVLQPPTQPVAPLQPIQDPSQVVLKDPAEYGYANPVFAEAVNRYIEEKKIAMEQARRAREAAMNSGGDGGAITRIAIGAGIGWLLVKFVL
jgi:hypothetical protein